MRACEDDDDKSGEETNADDKKKVEAEKEGINEHLITETEKQAEKDNEDAKEKEEIKKEEKQLKKDLKKDPYKQSIDILNTAPFVNLRAGGDKTSAKSAIASSENSPIDDPEGAKKYT